MFKVVASAFETLTCKSSPSTFDTLPFLKPNSREPSVAFQANVPNPVGKCLANVAMRSSLDGEARGQFDDILSVQLARARFAVLQIQAAEKSIQAPIAILLSLVLKLN